MYLKSDTYYFEKRDSMSIGLCSGQRWTQENMPEKITRRKNMAFCVEVLEL